MGRRARTRAWRCLFVVGMLVSALIAPLALSRPPPAAVRKETPAKCYRREGNKKNLLCIVCFEQCGFSVPLISLHLPTKHYSTGENFVASSCR